MTPEGNNSIMFWVVCSWPWCCAPACSASLQPILLRSLTVAVRMVVGWWWDGGGMVVGWWWDGMGWDRSLTAPLPHSHGSDGGGIGWELNCSAPSRSRFGWWWDGIGA